MLPVLQGTSAPPAATDDLAPQATVGASSGQLAPNCSAIRAPQCNQQVRVGVSGGSESGMGDEFSGGRRLFGSTGGPEGTTENAGGGVHGVNNADSEDTQHAEGSQSTGALHGKQACHTLRKRQRQAESSSSLSKHVTKVQRRVKDKGRACRKRLQTGLSKGKGPGDMERSVAVAAAAGLKQATAGLSSFSADLHHQLTLGSMTQAAATYVEVEQLARCTYAPLAELSVYFESPLRSS